MRRLIYGEYKASSNGIEMGLRSKEVLTCRRSFCLGASSSWRCVALIRDSRNASRLGPTCKDESEL